MIKRVTALMLRGKGACEDQEAIFQMEWPKGAPVNKATILRAVELRLDVEWAADRFLEAQARDEYKMAIAQAWEKSWEEYRRAKAQALISIIEGDK